MAFFEEYDTSACELCANSTSADMTLCDVEPAGKSFRMRLCRGCALAHVGTIFEYDPPVDPIACLNCDWAPNDAGWGYLKMAGRSLCGHQTHSRHCDSCSEYWYRYGLDDRREDQGPTRLDCPDCEAIPTHVTPAPIATA